MGYACTGLCGGVAFKVLTMIPETTLSYASIMGIKEDLNLVKDQYQWLGSLFYFGGSFSLRSRVGGMGLTGV